MGWFRRSGVTQQQLDDMRARLEARLSDQDSVIRSLEAEQATMHVQVRKWMRRAVAAEAREQIAPAGSVPAARRSGLWGARARRRLGLPDRPDMELEIVEPVERANGVHS